MERLRFFCIAVLTVWAGGAFAENAQSIVSVCVSETKAPGTYILSEGWSVPQVSPAQGGTQKGARNVNDCLQDKYQVQFGARPDRAVSALQSSTVQDECRRIRNRRITGSVMAVTGFALGLGDSMNAGAAIGGALGIGISANQASQRYKDCLAGNLQAERVTSTCSGQGNPMRGGTSYCK